jgi:hypothetical protein
MSASVVVSSNKKTLPTAVETTDPDHRNQIGLDSKLNQTNDSVFVTGEQAIDMGQSFFRSPVLYRKNQGRNS